MNRETKVSVYVYQNDHNGNKITIDPNKFMTVEEAIAFLQGYVDKK